MSPGTTDTPLLAGARPYRDGFLQAQRDMPDNRVVAVVRAILRNERKDPQNG